MLKTLSKSKLTFSKILILRCFLRTSTFSMGIKEGNNDLFWHGLNNDFLKIDLGNFIFMFEDLQKKLCA